MMAAAAQPARQRIRHRTPAAALRVHVGERAARARDRLRDRDRDGVADERLARAASTSSARSATSPRPCPHRPHTALVLRSAERWPWSGGLLTGARRTGRRSFVALMLGPVLVFVGIGPTLARNFPRRTSRPCSPRSCCSVGGRGRAGRARAATAASTCSCSSCRGSCSSARRWCSSSQHQQRHRPRRRPRRQAFAPGAARSRVSARAPLPHVDDARHVRPRRVHPRDACRCSRAMFAGQLGPVHARRVGRLQRRRRRRTRATRSRSTTLARRARRARGRAARRRSTCQIVKAPGLTQPRQWAATGFDAAFVAARPPTLDDRGRYSTDRGGVPTRCSPIRTSRSSTSSSSRRGGGPPSQHVKIGDQFTVARSRWRRRADVHGRGDRRQRLRRQRRVRRAVPRRTPLFGDRGVPSRAYLDVADPERVRRRRSRAGSSPTAAEAETHPQHRARRDGPASSSSSC